MSKWSTTDVRNWLLHHQFNQQPGLEESFVHECIDGEVLSDMTREMLQRIHPKIPVGIETKLLKRRDEILFSEKNPKGTNAQKLNNNSNLSESACKSNQTPEDNSLSGKNDNVVISHPTDDNNSCDQIQPLSIYKGEIVSKVQQITNTSSIQNDMLNLGASEMEASVSLSQTEGAVTYRYQALRKFDTIVDKTFRYSKNFLIDCNSLVTVPLDLICPVHRFVLLALQLPVEEESMLRFLQESLTFACACLNDRTNGTIHFGVVSEHGTNAKQGQIIGTTLARPVTFYIDKFYECVNRCFTDDQKDIVNKCIRRPCFIELWPSSDSPSYVIEIDIVPAHELCKNDIYFVRKPFKKDTKIIVNQATPYYFRDNTIQPIEGEYLKNFMKGKDALSEKRKSAEKMELEKIVFSNHSMPNLRNKLIRLLCKGEDTMKGEWYPILVMNKFLGNSSATGLLKENFSFIAAVKWKAVFDYDAEGTLCEYLQNKENMNMMIINSSNDFNNNSEENVENRERLAKLKEDIELSQCPPWIFINGRSPKYAALKTLDWKRERAEGFKEMVRFFKEFFPRQRVILVFMQISIEIDVFVESMEETILAFPGNWFCISECEENSKFLKDELLKRNFVDMQTLDDNFLTGLPWLHVGETIFEITRRSTVHKKKLPTSLGTFITFPKNEENLMTDLEILASNECDEDEIGKDEISFKNYIDKVEENFYRGAEVSWWNFWADEQVLRREKHSALLQIVQNALSGNLQDEEFVGHLILYHQPGAGGTTTAKQVLWDLRQIYRCAIIRTVSSQTVDQIFKLRSFQNSSAPKPVLLLADNLEQYENLVAELEEKVKRWCRDRRDRSLMCVILYCMRRSTMPIKYDEKKCVLLKHELYSKEKIWFKRKHEKLDKNHQENANAIDPKLLMSFNILKSEFNPDVILRMVTDVLKEMNPQNESNTEKYNRERKLLQYVAFLNSYDSGFNAIPTSVFDPIMDLNLSIHIGIKRGPSAVKARWETSLSSEIRILINESMASSCGYINSIRITHPLLSKVILQLLCTKNDTYSLSNVALDFLSHKEFFSNGGFVAVRKLQQIVTNVLIHRSLLPSGKREKQFAPLIQAIIEDESYDNAAQVLIRGFDIIKDAFIAQQLARLYILAKNWKEALIYIQKATKINPHSSYLWDTYGRIYQQQALELSKEWSLTLSPISAENCLVIIEIVANAVRMFRKVQEINEKDTCDNDAGYYGEIGSVITLFECLKCIDVLKKEDHLKRFLTDKNYKQPIFDLWIGEDGNSLVTVIHQLVKGAYAAQDRLEDAKLHFRDESFDEFKKSFRQKNYDILRQFKETLDLYLGENVEEIPDSWSEEKKCEYRRGQVNQLSGRTLLRFFDLRSKVNGLDDLLKISQLMQLNLKNEQYANGSDYMAIICANITLLTLSEKYLYKINYNEMAEWSRQLYLRKHELRTSLEPFLFYCLFYWPRLNTPHFLPDKELSLVLKQWKDAYYIKYPKYRDERKLSRKKETTIFFFANGSNLASIVSHEELKSSSDRASGDLFWEYPSVIRKLQRFRGKLCEYGNEVEVQLEYRSGSKAYINIATSFPIMQRDMWYRNVYFVIGFSWCGPKAFDIKWNDPTEDIEFMVSDHQATKVSDRTPYQSFRITDNKDASMKNIMKTLDHINIELTKIYNRKCELESDPNDFFIDKVRNIFFKNIL